MTDITFTGEGTQYSDDHEFKVSWDAAEEGSSPTEVNLKAIIPPWTREYILYGGVKKTPPRVDNAEGPRARDMVEQLEEEATQRQNE